MKAILPWLRVMAWMQGAAIAVLGYLVLDAADITPSTVAGHDATRAPMGPLVELPAPGGGLTIGGAKPDAVLVDAPASGVAPREGMLLFGVLVDEAGQPVPGATAHFTRDGETKPLTASTSDKEATFALAGLSSGRLNVRVSAVGFCELQDTIEIPVGMSRMRHDIVLKKAWTLAVKIVTPEGTPIAQALRDGGKERKSWFQIQVSALATPWEPQGDFPPTNLREADHGVGRWRSGTGFEAMRGGPRISKEFAGTLELDVRQPLWVSAVMRHHVLATARVEPGQPEVTLTVALDQILRSLGVVRLRVVDSVTGLPSSEARVGISDVQSSGAPEAVDAQGRIEVRDLRPGLHRLSIYAKDRFGPNAEVMIESGQTIDLGDIPLVAHRSIKGRCDNIDGKGDRISIQATSLDPSLVPTVHLQSYRAQAAEDGTFTLSLPDGRYFVRATGAGGTALELDTRALGEQMLILPLAKESSIRLDARIGGDPMELAIIASSGRAIFRRWVKDGWKFPITCLPGDYRIELKDRTGKVRTEQIRVGPDGVDLRLP